jgi:hypothetical protein
MSFVNRLLTPLFDLLMRPLQPLGTNLALVVVSAITAVAILLVVRATSDQRRIAAIKRQIHADFFEIRLFNDDLRAMLRAEWAILGHNATYLRLSLIPALWILIPAALVAGQLQAYFGYSGLEIGAPFLLVAQLKSDNPLPIVLDAPPAFQVETPAVWLPSAQQVVWRLRPVSKGDFQLNLKTPDTTFQKTIRVSNAFARRSPVRAESGLLTDSFYPSEPPLPITGPLSTIAVAYPERNVEILGRSINWLVVYAALSIVFGLLLRRPLRVEI